MKHVLLSPDLNWYRSNLHCHTQHSDGYWPPERVKAEYKKHGFSVVAFSDHNVIVDHSDLADPDFLPLTASEYDVSQLAEDLPPEQAAMGFRHRKTHHLNLFSKTAKPLRIPGLATIWGAQRNRFEGSEEERLRREKWTPENVNHLIEDCRDAGFLVQYNHPNWSLVEPHDVLPLRGLWSLEVLNWATEVETGGEFCPYFYDLMLRAMGPDLFCSMGDDNHNHGGDLVQSFGGSTFFGAKELSYPAIIEAMETGAFYCASGRDDPPRILGLWVESGVVHLDCTPAAFVWFVGDGRAWSDRRTGNITHAEFPLRQQDRYFRIALRDDRGNNALTHAYRVMPELLG